MENLKNYFKEKQQTQVFIICAFLGALAFLAIYGWRVIIPTYDDWIMAYTAGTDNMQHYMGWVAYRNSEWHFPIGLIENVLYPDLISVVYTDSIPLLAIPFKVLSPILPETFQYLGMYAFICLMLNGAVSGVILFKLTDKKIPSIMGSLFFSCSTVMLLRVFHHTALASHWIILICLYIWIQNYTDEQWPLKKMICAWSILSVLAVTIEAYFLPMVWGIMACNLLSDLINNGVTEIKKSAIRVVSVMGVAGIATVFVGWTIGLFYGGVSSSGDFFGLFAFDLLSFFNSMGSPEAGTITPYSKIVKPFEYNNWAYEGYSYLGIGIICVILALFIYACVRFFMNKYEITISRETVINKLPFILFFIGFSVASTSGVIRVGIHEMTLSLPQKVVELWSVFRSSGRLIWPIYYFILIYALVKMINILGKKKENYASLAMVFVLALQLYEASGYFMTKHELFYNKIEYVSTVQSEEWNELAQNYEHIMVYPNTQNVYSNYRGLELQYYALNNDMSLNIVYFARNVSEAVNQKVYEHFEKLKAGEEFDDTMYVFYDQVPENIYEDYGLYLYELDGYVIATPKPIESLETIQNQ